MAQSLSNTDKLRSPIARRGLLLALAAAGGLSAAAYWFNIGGSVTGDTAVSVQSAYLGAQNGDFTLIDIRRPEEWAHTGIGVGAIPIDMRDPEFIQKLFTHAKDANSPIALICARGVRSRGLGKYLTEAGFTNIIDVPEGMSGSGAGPGWLATGLPVRRP